MNVEYVEKIYDRQARYYDQLFGKVTSDGRSTAATYLDLFPGAHLLEVGVGTGLVLETLPRNIQFTGIDLAQKMLEAAHRRVVDLALDDVELMRMDASRMDFEDDSFDRVLAAYFISTVPDPVSIIKEMKRVCKPGGYLVFMNHFRYENLLVASLEKTLSPVFYKLGFRTDLSHRQLMSDAGLEIDLIEPLDFLGHWKAVRCVNP